MRRGISLGNEVRLKRSTHLREDTSMYRTAKDWSYMLPRRLKQPVPSYL